ncbi:MAG: MarR family transcriptional regulator [Deltaproteobacteria bacterium]|nr:MarR family transcriptional regulator [Deltaproteobacteria bacterium]
MNQNKRLTEQITRFVNQLIFLEKKSVFRYGEVTLYPSELHLMIVVEEGGAVNVTAMAEKLGVTKGAISQTVSRLIRKKMIITTKNPSRKNELTIHFTTTGQTALRAFSLRRAEHRAKFTAYLAELSEEEQRTIQTFLGRMEESLKGLK